MYLACVENELDDCEALLGSGHLCGNNAVKAKIQTEFFRPVVKGTINNVPANLLLDTGTSRTIVSATLIHAQNETNIPSGEICIGEDFCIKNKLLYAWDTYFTQADIDEINGMVGMDILGHFIFEMDQGEIVTLSRRAVLCSGVSYPLDYNEHHTPFISIQVDGISIDDVLIDTGSVYCLLNEKSVSLLDSYITTSAEETGGCSIEGCVDEGVFLTTVREFCIGSHCIDNVQTKYPVWDAVGNSYLNNFRINFNFFGNSLILCE